MSIRMKNTGSKRNMRRSHHRVEAPRLSNCTECGQPHIRHRACENCGTYRGRAVLDTSKQRAKQEKKQSEKAQQQS